MTKKPNEAGLAGPVGWRGKHYERLARCTRSMKTGREKDVYKNMTSAPARVLLLVTTRSVRGASDICWFHLNGGKNRRHSCQLGVVVYGEAKR